MTDMDVMAGAEFTQQIVVNNRVFLLGLDELYREAMKQLEGGRLLDCARSIAKRLHVRPAKGPVEGYYTESPELTEYFRLMRALQDAPESEEAKVASMAEFQLLWDLNNSGLFGDPARKGKLLPVGRDPLYYALRQLHASGEEWAVSTLASAAREIAVESDQYSLVSLAARAGDALAITALRESVVLYPDIFTKEFLAQPTYCWEVDNDIAAAANRFIVIANKFVERPLPEASSENAKAFHQAYKECHFAGRCVRIGKDDSTTPLRHYHWAIQWDGAAGYIVDDFWDDELWTTERYRDERYSG